MEKLLLSIIAALGLCVVLSHAVRQFHIVHDKKNMTEAQSYCREKYIDLATIDSMEDVNTLNSMFKTVSSKSSNDAWIGLYKDVDNYTWKWSHSDRSFYAMEEMAFTNWLPGQPDNESGGKNCTIIYDNGGWKGVSCSMTIYSFCMDVRGSNVTFVLISFEMTWTQAQSYCRSNYTDLASIRNMEENQKVKDLVLPGGIFWIGFFKDPWKWVDGSKSVFRYWDVDLGQPNYIMEETCVAADFTRSGKWDDWPCGSSKAFICYSELVPVSQKVVRVRLVKQNSSLDLNDPAVMEDLLNKFKQRLKDEGVNANITLSWKKQPDEKTFHKEKETKD